MTLPTNFQAKQITLNVPLDLLHELDQIAHVLNRPRSHVILKSLNRDLVSALRSEAKRGRRIRTPKTLKGRSAVGR